MKHMQDPSLGEALEELRTTALFHIRDVLKRGNLSEAQRLAWKTMQRNIARVAIGVEPGQESLFDGLGYRVQGEHVTQIAGNGELREEIRLPKAFLFQRGRLTLQGITTLFHEWAHNPLRFPGLGNRQVREMVEEQLADALAINLGIKMGFPPRALFRHLVGRMPFIGGMAYRRYLRLVENYAGEKFRKVERLAALQSLARRRQFALAWARAHQRRPAAAFSPVLKMLSGPQARPAKKRPLMA